MKVGLPSVRIAPAGVNLGGAAPSGPALCRPIRRESLHGWPWLLLGVASVLLWTHTLSLNAGAAAVLHWLPGLAILAALRFIWLNRSRRGLRLLAAGAACNLLVMITNGGLMPISPSTALAIGLPVRQANHTGVVLGRSKDRVIADSEVSLAYFDDRIVFKLGERHIAASIGDGIVVLGCAITLLEELIGTGGFSQPRAGQSRTAPARRRLHGL
jgi:uncharacterized protein DUF5317